MNQILLRLVLLIIFISFVTGPMLQALEVPLWLQMIHGFFIGWYWMRICDYFINLYYRARRGE